MLFVICILTCLQAYVIPWIIPSYEKTGIAATPDIQHVSQGFCISGNTSRSVNYYGWRRAFCK